MALPCPIVSFYTKIIPKFHVKGINPIKEKKKGRKKTSSSVWKWISNNKDIKSRIYTIGPLSVSLLIVQNSKKY